MIDWAEITILTYILMRISGFVLLNPLIGRNNVPAYVKAGLILVLTIATTPLAPQTAPVPNTTIEYALRLLLEFGIGYVVGFVTSLFFYVIVMTGEVIDMQMGLNMSKVYDPSSNVSLSSVASLLNILFILLFFEANGHLTLIRILMMSGEIVPFGAVTLGDQLTQSILTLFSNCTILGVKLAFPIFAAEFLGEMGMGVLMKTIPQINVFSVNVELKVLVGLLLLLLMFYPMGEFLYGMGSDMLVAIGQQLTLLR